MYHYSHYRGPRRRKQKVVENVFDEVIAKNFPNLKKEKSDDTIDQLDLIDIYRTFHPKTMNFTFFSSTHGTFSRIDHILGIKLALVNSKK